MKKFVFHRDSPSVTRFQQASRKAATDVVGSLCSKGGVRQSRAGSFLPSAWYRSKRLAGMGLSAHMVLLTAAMVQSATKAGRHSDTRIQPTNGTHPLQRVFRTECLYGLRRSQTNRVDCQNSARHEEREARCISESLRKETIAKGNHRVASCAQ